MPNCAGRAFFLVGLPCVPPAAQLYEAKDGADIHVHPAPDDATTVSVGSTLYFIAAIMVLCLGLVVSLSTNFRLKRELERQIENPSLGAIDEVDEGITSNEQEVISSDLTEADNNLETPLLLQQEQEEVTNDDNAV